jgi:hypothetical protein
MFYKLRSHVYTVALFPIGGDDTATNATRSRSLREASKTLRILTFVHYQRRRRESKAAARISHVIEVWAASFCIQ